MVQAAMRRYNGITNERGQGGWVMTKEEILVHVDHTLLKQSQLGTRYRHSVEEAIENHTASVCILQAMLNGYQKPMGTS